MSAKLAYLKPRRVAGAETGSPVVFQSDATLEFSQLLGAIYDGPLERAPWQHAMRLLKEHLNAAHALLMLRPPSEAQMSAMVNADPDIPEARASYDQRFFSLDPFVGLKEGEVTTPDEQLGSRWLETPMYREYLRPLGVRHILGVDLRTADGIECRLRITRGPEQPPFGDHEKALMRLIFPHLKRAIETHARLDRLECERQVLAGTVDRLQLGVISISQNGTLIEINDEARRILAENDGIGLTPRGLSLDSQQEKRELQRLIQQALSPRDRKSGPAPLDAMAISRPSGRRRLALMVKPVPLGEWSEGSQRRPAAVIYLRDPGSPAAAPSKELIRRLFGLTRTEGRLALKLSEGYTLDEAADMMNMRRNTARTHLRSIFYKTGVTRQTMLVRLMLMSVLTLD